MVELEEVRQITLAELVRMEEAEEVEGQKKEEMVGNMVAVVVEDVMVRHMRQAA